MGAVNERDFIKTDIAKRPLNANTIRERITSKGIRKLQTYDNSPIANIPHAELYNSAATNCNNSTTGTQATFWDTIGPLSNSDLFSLLSSGIKMKASCTIEATCNMYFESTVSRSNVGIEFTIDGVGQGIMGANDYIRAQNGHNESSTSITQILEILDGEKLGVMMYRLASAGTVSAPVGKSNLSLKVLK